ARYGIAGGALVVLGIAIAFSKRRTGGLDAGVETEVGDVVESAITGVTHRDHMLKDAIDRWVVDLREEEHELRNDLVLMGDRLAHFAGRASGALVSDDDIVPVPRKRIPATRAPARKAPAKAAAKKATTTKKAAPARKATKKAN